MNPLQEHCREVSRNLSAFIEQTSISMEQSNHPPSSGLLDTLHECGEPVIDLLRRQAKIVSSQQVKRNELVLRRLEDLISLANTKFYAYKFKEVPDCWRRLFTDASILKACSIVLGSSSESQNGTDVGSSQTYLNEGMIDIFVRTLDLSNIMSGSPGDDRREWIEEAFNLVLSLLELQHPEIERPAKRTKLTPQLPLVFPRSKIFTPPVLNPVRRVSSLDFEEFEHQINRPDDLELGPEPLIILGAIEHWPARQIRKWSNPSYLLAKTLGGRRLVPVEVGRSYVDAGWSQKLITFKEFMDKHLLPPNMKFYDDQGLYNEGSDAVETGYLAQHDLFKQIPSLRADIAIPDYCYSSVPSPHPSSTLANKHASSPQLEEPLLNAWFGPAGTISPLHTDPYHNILAQVVGQKYVRLYAPRETERLYSRGIEDGGVDMGNTSLLDVGLLEGWDSSEEIQKQAVSRFPLQAEARYVDLILQEGECLYIPLGWWHYVRSLSISFSVSFWWN